MKSAKKLLSFFLTAVIILTVALCGSLSAFAKDDFGTFEDGISADGHSYLATRAPIKDGSGFPNGDFSEGLRYYGHQLSHRPASDMVKLMEENGNYFIEFDAKNEWDGINSIMFNDKRVAAGDHVSVMFKYRGDIEFQVVLIQYLCSLDGKSVNEYRLGVEYKTIVIGSGAEGWNIGLVDYQKPSVLPSEIDPKYDDPTAYFNYYIQIKNDISCKAQLDDIQLVKFNKSNGIIKDLDGKQIYDLNNMPVDEEFLKNDDFGDYIKDTYNYEPEKETSKKPSPDGDTKSPLDSLVWIIAPLAVVLLLAAGTVATMILIKKKKAASIGDTSTDAPLE